jgi:hypothetical protein
METNFFAARTVDALNVHRNAATDKTSIATNSFFFINSLLFGYRFLDIAAQPESRLLSGSGTVWGCFERPSGDRGITSNMKELPRQVNTNHSDIRTVVFSESAMR